MFMADYNSDAIISDPLTSRADTELIHAQSKKLYEHFKDRGSQPRPHMFDNECYSLMNKFIS